MISYINVFRSKFTTSKTRRLRFQRVPRLDINPVCGTHTQQEPLIKIFVDASTTLGADIHSRKSLMKICYQIILHNFGYFVVSGYLIPGSDINWLKSIKPFFGHLQLYR